MAIGALANSMMGETQAFDTRSEPAEAPLVVDGMGADRRFFVSIVPRNEPMPVYTLNGDGKYYCVGHITIGRCEPFVGGALARADGRLLVVDVFRNIGMPVCGEVGVGDFDRLSDEGILARYGKLLDAMGELPVDSAI